MGLDNSIAEEEKILCVASSYEQKFYINPKFESLPQQIKDELKIMCVMYTADVGGILTLRYNEEGCLDFLVTSHEDDFFFDEIGSVLKVKQFRSEKRELLEQLENYYKIFFLGEDLH